MLTDLLRTYVAGASRDKDEFIGGQKVKGKGPNSDPVDVGIQSSMLCTEF